MSDHPQIFFPSKLETNFFNGSGDRSLDDLIEQHYADADPSVAFWGEGSTPVFQAKFALDNILEHCGENIHAFFALRHPIDRIVSHFYHDVKRNSRRNVQTLSDGRYVERSTYSAHAKRWINRLGERVHPLKFEHLVQDADMYLAKVTDALGLERLEMVPNERANTGFSIVRDGDLLRKTKGSAPTLPISELVEIHNSLKSDIEETQKITGLDLADWFEMPDWPMIDQA
ncbi:MAG: hypothetical protein HRT82_08780 [Henriciella sp.]|nr:hypothetical protein [Henriciella sp.]